MSVDETHFAYEKFMFIFVAFFFASGSIASKKEAKTTVSFTAIRAQECTIVASFLSDQLAGVRGKCTVVAS